MPNATRSLKRRRRIVAIVSAVLVLAVLIAGTLAWRDYDQHKSNLFDTAGLKHSVTLNEQFDRVTEWETGSAAKVDKKINVTNTGKDNGEYGDVFVRLQLKEFMEIMPMQYVYSEHRYMVAMPSEADPEKSDFVEEINAFLIANGVTNTNNHAKFGPASYENFVTFTSESAAKEFLRLALEAEDEIWKDRLGGATREVSAIQALDDVEINAVNGQKTPVTRWYIQTIANDPDGQYGKFIPLQHLPMESEKEVVTKREVAGVTQQPANASQDAADKHDDGTKNCLEWHTQDGWNETTPGTEVCATDKTQSQHLNGECSYLVHLWDETFLELCDMDTHTYIKWYLNAGSVITIKDWRENYGGQAVDKWIIDTDSEAGWVYWGRPLKPGETTPNLLEAAELIKQPGGTARYVIHTDMEAVDYERLGNWEEATPAGNAAPQDLLAGISGGANVQIYLSPLTATVECGKTQAFTAKVTGQPDATVTFTVAGGGGATSINSEGVLTVGADEIPGTELTIRATVNGKTAEAVVTVK